MSPRDSSRSRTRIVRALVLVLVSALVSALVGARVVADIPSDIQAANALAEAGDAAAADARYRAVLAKEPTNADAHRGLGMTAWRRGDLTRAREHYERAIRSDGARARFHAEMGGVLSDLRLHAEAAKSLRRSTELDPSDIELWRRYADILWRGERYPDAVTAYERAIALDPSDAHSFTGLGDTYLRVSRLPEALKAYDDALARDPKASQALVGKGAVLTKLGQPQDASVVLRQAVQANPGYAPAYYELGIAYQQSGEYERAVSAYGAAGSLNPQDPAPWANMARCLARLGHKEAAQRAYERSQALQSIHDELLAAQAYIAANPTKAEGYAYLAGVCQKANDVDGARRWFARALEIQPKYPQVHRALGDLSLVEGKLDDAASHYRQTLLFAPTDVEARVTLGLIYMEQGSAAAARAEFDRALQVAHDAVSSDSTAENWSLLSYAQYAVGQYDAAALSMEQAIRLEPSRGEYRERLEQIRQANQRDRPRQ
ncbi:tetratricopeptide repeat protein [Candidatus Poribacteria bacterium]|nr:tetratricopeptide repeat protein [Candidatus Poribacteria bacterium]